MRLVLLHDVVNLSSNALVVRCGKRTLVGKNKKLYKTLEKVKTQKDFKSRIWAAVEIRLTNSQPNKQFINLCFHTFHYCSVWTMFVYSQTNSHKWSCDCLSRWSLTVSHVSLALNPSANWLVPSCYKTWKTHQAWSRTLFGCSYLYKVGLILIRQNFVARKCLLCDEDNHHK